MVEVEAKEERRKEGRKEDRIDTHYEDEIELRDYLAVLWRRKGLIVGFVAAVMVATGVWALLKARSSTKHVTETLVQLNFSGIEKHHNPDGTKFDMYDIIRPEILSAAVGVIEDEEHRNRVRQKPRGYIFVEPFVPEEIKEKIEGMKKQKKTYLYLPNQFRLKFMYPPEDPLSAIEGERVLTAIAEGYHEDFISKYVAQSLLPVRLMGGNHDGYDYEDVVDILSRRIELCIGFLDKRIEEAGYYRGPVSGRSFVDIKSSLEGIRDIELRSLGSVISMASLTKSRGLLIQRYQHMIEDSERRRTKKQRESVFAKNLLGDLWSKNSLSVRKAEGGSSSEPLIVLDSSILKRLSGEDSEAYLLKKTLEAGVEAEHLAVEGKYLKDKLAKLKDDRVAVKSGGERTDLNYVRDGLDLLSGRIGQLVKDANELNREYLEGMFSSSVQIIKEPYSFTESDFNARRIMALSLVVSFMVAIFLALFVEYISKPARRT